MIEVRRLNDSIFYINPHQIEYIEKTPDTIIHMVSGNKYIVKDDFDNILKRILAYRKRLVDDNEMGRPSFYGNED